MQATLLIIVGISVIVDGQTKDCVQDSSMMKSNVLRLKKDLLCGYDKTVRPVIHHSNKTTVYITLFPKYFYMDETYHSLGISCILFKKWTDEFLKWNPAEYGGLNDFFFDSNTIWSPVISTSTNPNNRYSGGSEEVGVFSNGQAITSESQYYSSPCDLDHTYWPYDVQHCKLTLQTTSFYQPYLDLRFLRNNDDKYVEYLHNLYRMKGPWVLKSITQERKTTQLYQYQEIYVVNLTYTFTIQRRASSYYSAIMTAGLVLPLLVLSSFWLEPGSGSRLNLCMVAVVCHLFYIEKITLGIRSSREMKPIVVIYTEWCVLLAAMSLIFTIITRFISDLSTGPYILHRLSSWICSNRYAQSFLIIDVDLKNCTSEGSEDESSLVIKNGRFYQQWRILATFIDRMLFLIYFLFYIFLYQKYFPS